MNGGLVTKFTLIAIQILRTASPQDANATGDAPAQLTCAAPTQRCGDSCVDLSSDPDNCGSCGHVCASGLCTESVCEGALAGHIVAIGHDFVRYDLATRQVEKFPAPAKISHMTVDKSGVVYVSCGPDLYRMTP